MKKYFIFFVVFFSFSVWAQKTLTETTTRIAVISDLNGSYGSTTYGTDVHQAVKKIQALKPDLVLSTGDMIAGQKAGLNYASMWESFHQAVTYPLQKAQIPLAVTVGNHDGSGYPQFKNERAIFINEWKKQKPQLIFSNQDFYPQYYSFIFKDKLFISLDSTIVGSFPTAQLLWLETELKKHEKLKHKIIFTHVPLFGFAQMDGTGAFFDPILYSILTKYKVDFYLTGHNHAYYPGYNDGIHHVSQGCLGSAPRPLVGEVNKSARTLTVIDFSGGNFKIYAYKGPSFTQILDHQLLPTSIPGDAFDITLRDKNL